MTALSASVVIATFDRADQLARLIADLAVQDRQPDEVIVVDDGSESPVSVSAPANAQFTVQVLRQPNTGPAGARHTGIQRAASDVIIVLDDDMRVGPSFVGAHLDRHEAGAMVVQAPFRNVTTHETPLFDAFTMRQHEQYFDACTTSEASLDPARLTTGNVSFRADLYRQVGGFDTSLRRCEDRELGIAFAEAGAVLGFASDAIAMHQEAPESIDRWLTVARQYGAAELAIANKHPLTLDPWDLYYELPGVARFVVRRALSSARMLPMVVRLLVHLGRVLQHARLAPMAIKAYGMAYALAWFQGLFEAFPDPAAASASLHHAIRRRHGRRRVLFGQIGVDVVDMDEAVQRTVQLASSGSGGIVVTPNIDHLMLYGRSSGFRSAYDRADLVLADGMPMVMLSRALFLPLRHKVSGSDFIVPLMRAAADNDLSVFLLGSSDKTAALAEQRLRERFDSLRIVGRASPWYEPHRDDDEMMQTIEHIRRSGAQLVLVAFGAPKQEQFLTQYGDRLPAACFICCGASLDFIAGVVRRAPTWMSQAGLEWLYRLAMEPRRLWKRYLVRDSGAILLFSRMVVSRVAGRQLVVAHPGADAAPPARPTSDAPTTAPDSSAV